MYCLCKANTLRQFIRNVAHIDVKPAFQQASAISSLQSSRRTLNTFSALRTQHTSLHLQQSTEARPKISTHTEDETTTPSQDGSHGSESEPAVFEITPDVIDELAAGAAKHSLNNDGGPLELEYTKKRVSESHTDSNMNWATTANKPNKRGAPINSTYTIDPSALRRNFRSKHTEEPEASGRISKNITEKKDDDWTPPPRLPWQSQKAALKEKFQEGWAPRKRLSPDALAGIRAINSQFPDQYTVPVLAAKFEVSPEAIRRILKSNWRPDAEEEEDRKRRWYKRGQQVWTRYAELGLKPPRKWRDVGIGKREKGWRSKEAEQQKKERETLSTTWNPRLTRKSDGDGFV